MNGAIMAVSVPVQVGVRTVQARLRGDGLSAHDELSALRSAQGLDGPVESAVAMILRIDPDQTRVDSGCGVRSRDRSVACLIDTSTIRQTVPPAAGLLQEIAR
jgi:hypothetical protein